MKRILITLLCICFSHSYIIYGQIADSWQLFESMHPTDDMLVAVHVNQASGQQLDNTGATDVSAAFQSAIDNVFNAGGGVIYVPAGRYRFDGSLIVKEGVSIRGDFMVPDEQTPVAGTIFEVYGGRNNSEASPFITMRGSCRLDGVSIWYPEQVASSIVPYPPTILNLRNPNGRYPKHLTQLYCLNLVNSYIGIDIGIVNTALPVVGHIYGSPLKTGLEIKECTDVSRLFNIHFTPMYWTWSGLPGAPAENGSHATFMKEQGIGINYVRSDNGFNGFWEIKGYQRGMAISYPSGGPFYNIDIQDCVDGITLNELNQVPVCFSNSVFEGSNASLVLNDLSGAAQFFNSDFRSSSATVKAGPAGASTASNVSFHTCDFNATAFLSGRYAGVSNSSFNFTGDHVVLGSKNNNVVLMDNHYQGEKKIVNQLPGSAKFADRDTTKNYQSGPAFTYVPFFRKAPTRKQLYLATANDGVISGDGANDAPGIQAVLNTAGNEGGGIVFIPAGEYNIQSPLSIPDNVELRGVLDNTHHSRLLVNKDVEHEFGTFFLMEDRRGVAEGYSIRLNANSGLRGISFYYPGQTFYQTGSAVPFPWLFGIAGDDAYIKNITAVNPYQILNMAEANLDSLYLENIVSYPLFTGIRIGKGSSNVKLRNVHYNNHMLGQAYYPNDDDKLEFLTLKDMDLFQFGHTENLEMLFCFGRQCLHGVVLEDEDGKGPNGISIGFGVEEITKGSCIEVTGNDGFTFVNASLLSDNMTVDFDTDDSLSLFNSRTKNSRHFIQSGGKGGKLFFNQVLHRGENTIIESKGDHIEIINAAFFTNMEFHVQEASFPAVIYGGYLKSGDILIACEPNEVSWKYLPGPYESYTDLKLNLDLFLLPGGINYNPNLSVGPYENDGLLCFPNPASDHLTLRTETEIIAHVRIFDMQGRLVYQNQPNESSVSVAVSEIGLKGLYFVQTVSNGKRRSILVSIL